MMDIYCTDLVMGTGLAIGIMEILTLVNGKVEGDMELEFIVPKMEKSTLENGKMVYEMVLELGWARTEKLTKEPGKKTILATDALKSTQTETHTKVLWTEAADMEISVA